MNEGLFRLEWNLEPMHDFWSSASSTASLDLARVLIVHGELAPRLALQTILQAGGYAVEVAATPSEALAKLDEGEFELVLSDTDLGSPEDGRKVLAYARVKEYRPATALITGSSLAAFQLPTSHNMSIHTEDIPLLLGKVAELIGLRARRRSERLVRAAG
jgi:CheY-like chemotaxis protein